MKYLYFPVFLFVSINAMDASKTSLSGSPELKLALPSPGYSYMSSEYVRDACRLLAWCYPEYYQAIAQGFNALDHDEKIKKEFYREHVLDFFSLINASCKPRVVKVLNGQLDRPIKSFRTPIEISGYRLLLTNKSVQKVSLNTDGTKIAIIPTDNKICYLDLSKRMINKKSGFQAPVTTVFRENNNWKIDSAWHVLELKDTGFIGEVRKPLSGELLSRPVYPQDIWRVAYDTAHDQLHFRNERTWEEAKLPYKVKPVNICMAGPNRVLIATANGIKLWDLLQKKCLMDHPIHPDNSVNNIDVCPLGEICLISTLDCNMICCITDRLKKIRQFDGPFSQAKLSPVGSLMLCADRAGTASLCDWQRCKLMKLCSLIPNDKVNALDFSGDGQTCAVGTDKALYIWSIANLVKGKSLEQLAVLNYLHSGLAREMTPYLKAQFMQLPHNVKTNIVEHKRVDPLQLNLESCPICFEEGTAYVTTKCNHHMCGTCYEQIKSKTNSCPICRQAMD